MKIQDFTKNEKVIKTIEDESIDSTSGINELEDKLELPKIAGKSEKQEKYARSCRATWIGAGKDELLVNFEDDDEDDLDDIKELVADMEIYVDSSDASKILDQGNR